MKSFRQHITELKQEDWDYYSEISYKRLANPFINGKGHISFVQKYFNRSGKGKVLKFIDFIPGKRLDKNRIVHSNSIFFLGILLNKNTSLKYSDYNKTNKPGYNVFSFIWFLTCLFHDFGFTLEDDKKLAGDIDTIDKMNNKYGITNNLLEANSLFREHILTKCIEQYFNYRIVECKVVDHGISAGLYFYDRLFKIREEKEFTKTHPLYWGKDLLQQYAEACFAIATHNIWLPNKQNISKYISHQLDSLVNDFKPIKFSDFPMLYLLGIVDTIDPVKAYKDEYSATKVLDEIILDFKSNKITIMVVEGSSLNLNRISEKACNLIGWLDVGIHASADKVTIEIFDLPQNTK